MIYFKVNNLTKYQTLTKTKRYALIDFRIFDDYKYCKLSNDGRLMWFCCIVLASSCANKVPFDGSWLAHRVLKTCSHMVKRAEDSLQELLDLELISLCDLNNRVIDRLIDKEKLQKMENDVASKREETREFLKAKGILKRI